MSPPEHFNEDRPILSAARCRPMIVISKNIRYMRILAGFLGEGRQIQYIMLPYTCVQTSCSLRSMFIVRAVSVKIQKIQFSQHQSHLGYRTVKFKGSQLWNRLPHYLVDITSPASFRKSLKHYLTYNPM